MEGLNSGVVELEALAKVLPERLQYYVIHSYYSPLNNQHLILLL